MADLVRRAGAGRFVDGTDVVWSVAEGQRGRRWREVRTRDGQVLSSLLLETFPNRGFAHLELSTAAGLLTLHPEPDGRLHGNAVTRSGVRHVVAFPWADDGVLLVEGSPTSKAAAVFGLADETAVDEQSSEPRSTRLLLFRSIVLVDLDLTLELAPINHVERLDDRHWIFAGGITATVEADALPWADAGMWALEE